MSNYDSKYEFAVRYGDINTIKEFIAKGHDINYKSEGSTLLHLAIFHGHIEIIKLLLENKADSNAKGFIDNRPLHVVFDIRCNIAVFGFKVLSENVMVEIIKLLLEFKADINAKNSFGSTPLHNAAHRGHFESVKYLLSMGADNSIKNNKGCLASEEAKTTEIKDYINSFYLEMPARI